MSIFSPIFHTVSIKNLYIYFGSQLVFHSIEKPNQFNEYDKPMTVLI